MLPTNQHLNKLAATHANFDSCGMLKGTYVWDQILHAFFNYILITFIILVTDTNGPESDLTIPHEDALDGNTNKGPGSKQHNDDDDGVDADGPMVEACVELSKIACKYILHLSILQKYINLHDSMQILP